jgi:hypothetical protein
MQTVVYLADNMLDKSLAMSEHQIYRETEENCHQNLQFVT